jgi:hypothetical protein
MAPSTPSRRPSVAAGERWDFPLGAALTRQQVRQPDTVIGVASRDVVIALEADPAGRAAAERAL